MSYKTAKIPNNWKTTVFENAVDIIDGDRGVNYPRNDEFCDDGYCLFLNTKNVPNTAFSFKEKMFINKDKDSKLRKGKLTRGDFVLTTRGTIGNFAFYSDKIPFENVRINSGMVILRPKTEKLDKAFFNFYLRSTFFQDQALSLTSGTAQPQLPIKDLKYFEIILPPLSEQRIIASVPSSLSDKIDLLGAQNKTLENIAQALFKHWFIDFEFPDKNGKPYKSSSRKMVDSEFGEIPEGWRVENLGEVTEVRGGTTPSTDVTDYWNGNIYWTSPKDLSNSRDIFLLDTEKKITEKGLSQIGSGLLPEGTLLLSSRAPIGYLAITNIQVAINQGYIALLPGSTFSNYYMYLWLKENMREIISASNGSTFLEISKGSFKTVLCVVPGKNILDNFQAVITPIFEKILLNVSQIRILSQIRDTILPKLMTGKVRVKEFAD